MMLCAQMTHYPPPSTLELYESDPRIDLDGLLSLVDLFGCFLLASPSTHTYSCWSALCNHCHTLSTDAASTSLYSRSSHQAALCWPGARAIRLFGWDTDWRWAPARWHCTDHHQATTDNAASSTVWSSDHQQMPFVLRRAYILDCCCDSGLFRAPSSHGCMLAPPIHVFLSRSLVTAAPSVL